MEDEDQAGEEQRGPIQEKTSGRWCKTRLLVDGVLYQLQYVRCGQKRCRRCADPDPAKAHGPYWFAYTTKAKRGGRPGKGGEWRARYIGRDTSGLPAVFHEALRLARR